MTTRRGSRGWSTHWPPRCWTGCRWRRRSRSPPNTSTLPKERLILARATHLDSLAAWLAEPRVRTVIEPLIAGELEAADPTYTDDIAYLRDLGLLAPTRPARIANPIYREVIVRVLGDRTEEAIVDDPRSFVLPDSRLDFRKLLHEFAAFWRANGEVLTSERAYHEVAPQLVVMAYIHRIVNGGGYIDREYGVGYRRIDLLVRWPYRGADGNRAWQQAAVELKVWRPGRRDPLGDGYRDAFGRRDLATFSRRQARGSR